MEIRFRPLSNWPVAETTDRRHSRFDTGWYATMNLLKHELERLHANNVVIEMDLTEVDIRRDGLPRNNARPETPRVCLSMDSPYGPLRYPCDTFLSWQDNVRGIALALEALRKVDRYGVTKRGEQYTGWKALPASTGHPTTPELAASVVSSTGKDTKLILNAPAYAKQCIRDALLNSHPDQGGEVEKFHLVQEARRVLSDFHGRKL